MNLNERFDVSPEKIEALRRRVLRLGLDLSLVTESFVKGGGKGGQKINKTANCVRLEYPPLGLSVRCQRDRRRSVNRFLALRELVDEAEMKISPETSERLRDIERERRRKSRRRSRAAQKYQAAS